MNKDKSPYSRRRFLRDASAGALSASILPGMASGIPQKPRRPTRPHPSPVLQNQPDTSVIGPYGSWAAGLVDGPPELSFRRDEWTHLDQWRMTARARFLTRLAQPNSGDRPSVTVQRQHVYDGLHIEHLEWQLPYGPPTRALLLRPEDVEHPLPGVLALHDHGGNKYFGRRKITRTSDDQHPMMVKHQEQFYSGRAWANELARQGYVVLVPDAFAFASRRVRREHIEGNRMTWRLPDEVEDRIPLVNPDTEKQENIDAYNSWAAWHEHVMAKSLFSAGTTWPGVFVGEDQRALDVLANRSEVDADRLGCAGLSGGGLRTVYLSGADPRIQCAVPVGLMTTWDDLILNRSVTHTWMVYVPILPRELDYPEILGLQVPTPSLVLNNREDPLFTLEGMKEADRILGVVYDKADASDRYRTSFYPGPHKFDSEMQEEAFAWFAQWL